MKLLGEGGFSYVYLAEDLESGRLFALKKIRCPLGSDSVREALKEVEGGCAPSEEREDADGEVQRTRGSGILISSGVWTAVSSRTRRTIRPRSFTCSCRITRMGQ
jgi:serine/threonine protein kinase